MRTMLVVFAVLAACAMQPPPYMEIQKQEPLVERTWANSDHTADRTGCIPSQRPVKWIASEMILANDAGETWRVRYTPKNTAKVKKRQLWVVGKCR